MRIARSAVFAAALSLLAACAGAGPRTTPPAPTPDPDLPATTPSGGPAGAPAAADPLASSTRPRSRRDVVTEQEIATAHVADALELVRRLRPEWLRSATGRGQASVNNFAPTQVYYNGRLLGDLNVLREISSAQVVSIRWVDPIQARTIYGRNNNSGVISITGR